jgi:hypothetical protein
MRNPGAAASLMDDTDFLAEIEKFDAHPIENERIPSAAMPANSEAEWTWEARPTFDERATVDEPEPTPADDGSATRVALGIAGFLLMMCLGGAAAALMFHDRVAQILR